MHRTVWAVKRTHWKCWTFGMRILRATKSGLTPARFDALHVLATRGEMRQSMLQRLLGVVRSTVSELLGELEKRGFVERGKRTLAGRTVKVTERGVDALANAFRAQLELHDELTDALGGPWRPRTFVKMLLLERFCVHVRRRFGEPAFARVFGWLEPDD